MHLAKLYENLPSILPTSGPMAVAYLWVGAIFIGLITSSHPTWLNTLAPWRGSPMPWLWLVCAFFCTLIVGALLESMGEWLHERRLRGLTGVWMPGEDAHRSPQLTKAHGILLIVLLLIVLIGAVCIFR
jgi:hypothetical protein